MLAASGNGACGRTGRPGKDACDAIGCVRFLWSLTFGAVANIRKKADPSTSPVMLRATAPVGMTRRVSPSE
jgi:hypothetical protein